jgi:hypothetical protein
MPVLLIIFIPLGALVIYAVVRPEAAPAPRRPRESRRQLGGADGSCERGRPRRQWPRRRRLRRG